MLCRVLCWAQRYCRQYCCKVCLVFANCAVIEDRAFGRCSCFLVAPAGFMLRVPMGAQSDTSRGFVNRAASPLYLGWV